MFPSFPTLGPSISVLFIHNFASLSLPDRADQQFSISLLFISFICSRSVRHPTEMCKQTRSWPAHFHHIHISYLFHIIMRRIKRWVGGFRIFSPFCCHSWPHLFDSHRSFSYLFASYPFLHSFHSLHPSLPHLFPSPWSSDSSLSFSSTIFASNGIFFFYSTLLFYLNEHRATPAE